MTDQNGDMPPTRRVVLEVTGERLNIAAEGCVPEFIEATLLRALAYLQREMQAIRMLELADARAAQVAQQKEMKRRIDLR